MLPLGSVAEKIKSEGVQVYSLNMRFKADIGALWRLYLILEKVKPHILHTQLFHANLVGRIIGSIAGVPIIISSIRNTFFGGKMREFLLRWTDRWAVKSTIICQTAGNRMVKNGIVPEAKLIVIYNGIDTKSFDIHTTQQKAEIQEELGYPSKKALLLAVGRLHKQKGYPYLLESINLLKNQGHPVELAIVGTGEMLPHLEQQVKKLDLEDCVRFLGVRDDVPRLMAIADVFVLSSLWEGLPGVVLEAMASGLPVVSTSVGGAVELVVDGETGFLVPLKDPVAMADAVSHILALSEEDRALMGRAGRNRVEQNFTLDKMVSAYEKLYAECLGIKV